MDRCESCYWFQEEPDLEVIKFWHNDGYCRAFPAKPNGGIPRKKSDYCSHHRPKRVGFELRLGGWLFRIEHKRTG